MAIPSPRQKQNSVGNIFVLKQTLAVTHEACALGMLGPYLYLFMSHSGSGQV